MFWPRVGTRPAGLPLREDHERAAVGRADLHPALVAERLVIGELEPEHVGREPAGAVLVVDFHNDLGDRGDQPASLPGTDRSA
jgi:hypothetical protein